jgi:hypothetical protein
LPAVLLACIAVHNRSPVRLRSANPRYRILPLGPIKRSDGSIGSTFLEPGSRHARSFRLDYGLKLPPSARSVKKGSVPGLPRKLMPHADVESDRASPTLS